MSMRLYCALSAHPQRLKVLYFHFVMFTQRVQRVVIVVISLSNCSSAFSNVYTALQQESHKTFSHLSIKHKHYLTNL